MTWKTLFIPYFKFQSDSINTHTKTMIATAMAVFKFQSDSINTMLGSMQALYFLSFKFQSDSINTNTWNDKKAVLNVL